jgi:magnesium chelatase subunit D
VNALPFSGVVGQDDAKLALLLAAAEPRLGGVLLRGQKGSAKTTLARGLARLLPGDAPFVELPLGATEDRVLGSLDLAELLAAGTPRFRPGLLAAAHGGVLYVDEINLLADHLVDALLDVAVTGVNRVEREGVSHTHPARFVLVGSMNPEEGELRPQLLDRFGLAADVVALSDVDERALVVRRQLVLDADPGAGSAFASQDDVLRADLAATHVAEVPDDVVRTASAVAVAVGAEGLRADIMLCRAAAALAGWERREHATGADLRRVAALVLAHRRRRMPFDAPGIDDEQLDDAFSETNDVPSPEQHSPDREADDADATAPLRPPALPQAKASERSGSRARAAQPRGRFVRDVAATDDSASIAAVPTAIAAAHARAVDATAPLGRGVLREAVREHRTGNLIVLLVDTSSSMGVHERIAFAKGAALGFLTEAYQRRDRVAVVAFRGERAEVVLRPTGSVEIARRRLAELPIGGTTPLADALDTALGLAESARRDDLEPVMVLITDGRATCGGSDPVTAAFDAAQRVAAANVASLVVDSETGGARLGLAQQVARHLGAPCTPLQDLADGALRAYVRDLADA